MKFYHWGQSFLYFLLFYLFTLPLTAQTYLDYIGAGHHEGITVTSSSNSNSLSSESTINGHGIMVDTFGASRFLGQATLGVSE